MAGPCLTTFPSGRSRRLEWAAAILLGLGAYSLGSFPAAYILVHLARGIDLREVGTGNVGALNAFHQIGWWGGLLVLAVDAAKGALSVLVPDWVGAPDWTIFLSSALVIAGHNWPVFLGFRGGKGAAAIFGISLVVAPALTLITLVAVVLIVLLIRNVVWGAAFGFVLLNALLLATQQDADEVALCGSLTLLVTVTYVVGNREHITRSIKARHWRELITGLA